MNKFAALLAAGMLLSGCVYNSRCPPVNSCSIIVSTSVAARRSTPATAAGLKTGEDGYYRQDVCIRQYVQRL